MAPTLKVDTYDFSTWLQLAHDAGINPTPDIFDPKFSGSGAFTEGQGWVDDAIGNRIWEMPIIIKAADVDTLYQTVRDINSHLFQGAQVEFKLDGASNSSYFDLERGRLECNFQYYIARSGRCRAVLRLWSRPYAHTGTTRTLASLIATGPVQIPATGVLGDVDALANLTLTSLGPDVSASAMVLYGITGNASYIGVWPGASITPLPSGALIGASGAVASQYRAIYASPTAAGDDVLEIAPPLSPYGRNRVIALGRGHLRAPGGSGAILRAYDYWTSQPVGTALLNAVASGGRFQAFDLGEWNVEAKPTGIADPTTHRLRIQITGASGASSIASPGLDITAVVFIPLDQAAGVMISGDWRQTNKKEVYSYPIRTVYKDIQGAERLNAMNEYRGGAPRIPHTGTSMPSGPAQLIVAALQDSNAFGNFNYGVKVTALERFQFMR